MCVAIYAAVVTFLAYATVYAFRKPFTVGSFEQEPLVLGIHYNGKRLTESVYRCVGKKSNHCFIDGHTGIPVFSSIGHTGKK